MSSGRNYVRRFVAAGKARDLRDLESPNLFAEAEAMERRKTQLIFVIQRLARRLCISHPAFLHAKSIGELDAIRVGLSKQIALRKRAPQEDEMAA